MYPYPYPETSLTLGTPRDKPYHPGTLHFRRPPHGPGTYPIAHYTVYTSGGHHMAQGYTLLCSTLHISSGGHLTWPKGPPPQSLQHTLPSGAEHTQQCTKLLLRQDCKSASQHRRALCPRDTARHISKNSANQQNKRVRVFILQEQIKVAMAWVPADPPVSWMAISTVC